MATTPSGGKPRKPVVKRQVVKTEPKTLADSAPLVFIQLRQSLKTARWETNRKILDIVALVCGTEQAWRTSRSQILKLLNDEDALILLLINRFGMPEQEQEIQNVV